MVEYTLLAFYVWLAGKAWLQGMPWRATYWVGAFILTLAVVKGLKK